MAREATGLWSPEGSLPPPGDLQSDLCGGEERKRARPDWGFAFKILACLSI